MHQRGVPNKVDSNPDAKRLDLDVPDDATLPVWLT